MTTPTPVLQAPEGTPLDVDALVAALAKGFTVGRGARQRLHRTGLDTFDRRLRAAGLSLQHVVQGGHARLVLDRNDSASAATTTPAPAAMSWPAFADALPEGAVRDAVAPVSDIRALMVVSDQRRQVRRLELRNEDAKLVVRVSVEDQTVTVEPLRGYADEARRAHRLLTRAGLRPVDPVEAVLTDETTDASHTAGTTDRRDRSAPAAGLLAAELAEFHATLRATLTGLLDDVDTEFLHDFRVAVRRTRATLKLGRAALPAEMRERWEGEFKWLGDLTTPVRDLDVYLLELPGPARWLFGADAADLRPFATHVRKRRTAERRALVRGLRSVRYRRLDADWEQALARLAHEATQPEGPVPGAGELADSQITRAYRRVARQGAAISADSPAEDLHTLRKRCKELRYALEVYAPVIDASSRKAAISDLKSLQDVLGRFQDSEVQRQSLREFAQVMMQDGTSAEAVLAMGELVGHLDAEQD